MNHYDNNFIPYAGSAPAQDFVEQEREAPKTYAPVVLPDGPSKGVHGAEATDSARIRRDPVEHPPIHVVDPPAEHGLLATYQLPFAGDPCQVITGHPRSRGFMLWASGEGAFMGVDPSILTPGAGVPVPTSPTYFPFRLDNLWLSQQGAATPSNISVYVVALADGSQS